MFVQGTTPTNLTMAAVRLKCNVLKIAIAPAALAILAASLRASSCGVSVARRSQSVLCLAGCEGIVLLSGGQHDDHSNFLLRWRAGARHPNRNQCLQLCGATLLQVGRRQIHQLEDRQTG